MTQETEALLKRAQDLGERCERTACMTSTGFLTPAEQLTLIAWAKGHPDYRCVLHGGHTACERKVLFFLPFYEECADFSPEESICAIFLTAHFGVPDHRDYLGSIMGLGVKREWVGDIWVSENTATVFCLPSILQHLLDNLTKVANYGVTVKLLPLDQATAPEKHVKRVDFTVQSLRLDAVAGGMFRLSRTTSAALIREGSVCLNYSVCQQVDAVIHEGDVISIRGHGKSVLSEIGGASKKGRLFLHTESYQ